MTYIADVNFNLRYSASRCEGIATTTLHYRFLILWVDVFFHRVILSINEAGRGKYCLLTLTVHSAKDNNAGEGTRQLVPPLKGQNDLLLS